jgi:hypothetical protein
MFDTQEEAKQWAAEAEERLKPATARSKALANPDLVKVMPPKVLEAMQRVKHSLTDLVSASHPAPDTCGVYFLIRDGVVTYVGKTTNVLARLTKHRRMGKVFDSFTFIPCAESEMTQLEGDYIMAYWPAENRAVELS